LSIGLTVTNIDFFSFAPEKDLFPEPCVNMNGFCHTIRRNLYTK